jgi:hypothetical protein
MTILDQARSLLVLLVAMTSMMPRAIDAQPEARVEVRLQAQINVLDKRVLDLESERDVNRGTIKTLTTVQLAQQERIKSLEARVQTLDQRLQQLTKQLAENSKPDVDDKNPKPLTVRAPLVVVDAQGKQMMHVDQGPLGPTLTMFGTNGTSALLSGHDLIIRTGTSDPSGVRIGVGARGNGHVFLTRKGGETAADIGFDQTTERLGLRFYNNRQIAAEIGVAQAAPGAGFLQLGNGSGTTTAEIGTNTKNEMSLKVRSNTGQVVAGLGVNPDGGGGGAIKLANGKGDILASMIAAQEAGHVNVFGVDGKARANMGAEPDGRGFLRIASDKNEEAASLTIDATGGGALQVRDPKGIGAVLSPRLKSGVTFGDFCVQSSKQKGLCFSQLAAKNIMPYF